MLEDPLSYLPCSAISEFRKGHVIYDSEPPQHLFLVIEGCVKVSRPAGHSEVVINLCQADDFFGEPAFVHASGERAVTLEPTRVMSWQAEVVRDLILRHPQLGIALIQSLAHRCHDLGQRMATLSAEPTTRRLAKALVDLSERLGEPDAGSESGRRLSPYPHRVLAQYIGTTREAVTHCMNEFRRQGFVSYTRRDLIVRGDAVRDWLAGTVTPRQPLTPEVPQNLPGTLSA